MKRDMHNGIVLFTTALLIAVIFSGAVFAEDLDESELEEYSELTYDPSEVPAEVPEDDPADLAITKTFLDANTWQPITTAEVGDLVYVRIDVTNNGPDMASMFTVTDLPTEGLDPAGRWYVHYSWWPRNYWRTNSNSVNSDGTAWDGGMLLSGQSATLAFLYEVTQAGVIENMATVAGLVPDPDYTNNQASATLDVPVDEFLLSSSPEDDDPADLAITKTFLDANTWLPITTAHVGDLVYVRIDVTNNGPDMVMTFSVTDLPTEGLDPAGTWWTHYSWYAPDFWVANSPLINPDGTFWMGLPLLSGQSATLAFLYEVTQLGLIENTATIVSLVPDPDYSNNEATGTLDVVPVADVIVQKGWADIEWTSNIYSAEYMDEVYLWLHVHNMGPDPAEDVVVTDVIDPTLFSLDLTGVEISYDGGQTWISDPDLWDFDPLTNTLTWYVGTVPLLDGDFPNWYNLRVPVLVLGHDTTIENTATETQSTDHPNPEHQTGTGYLEVGPAADIAVEKEFLDGTTWQPISSASPGDLVYGLINVINNGPDPATGVTVLDLPTTGLEYMGTYYTSYDDGATWQYLDGSFDAASGVWTVGNMPPDDSYLLAILYQVSGTDTIYNVAVSDRTQAEEYDWNLYNNEDVAILDILEADVWTSKEVENLSHPGDIINYLDDIRYLISVGNNGPDTAENVMAWETIPTGFDLDTWAVSWDNGITWISEDPSFDPITGWWEIGNLANGAVALLRLDGTVTDSNFELYNYADAYGDTYDPNLDNNWDEITLQIPPAADLTITKESDRMRYHIGDLVSFWIELYNWGPDTAENVEVADFLSPGLTLIDYDLSTGYLDEVDMIWYVGDLEAEEGAWLELICQATSLGTQTNTVVVTSDTYDPYPEDNTDTATIGVIPPANDRPIPTPPCPPHWTCQGHQVPMQPTGAPLGALGLGMVSLISGLAIIRRP